MDLTKQFFKLTDTNVKFELKEQSEITKKAKKTLSELNTLLRVMKYEQISNSYTNEKQNQIRNYMSYFELQVQEISKEATIHSRSQKGQAREHWANLLQILEQSLQKLVKFYRDLEMEKLKLDRQKREQELKDKKKEPLLLSEEHKQDKQHQNQIQMQTQIQREDNSDQLEDVERVVFELTNLMSRFSTTLLEQQSQSITILENTQESVRNVEHGKKELQEAQKYQGNWSRYIAYIFIALSFFLLFLDWATTKVYFY